jgi:hypothetical protein
MRSWVSLRTGKITGNFENLRLFRSVRRHHIERGGADLTPRFLHDIALMQSDCLGGIRCHLIVLALLSPVHLRRPAPRHLPRIKVRTRSRLRSSKSQHPAASVHQSRYRATQSHVRRRQASAQSGPGESGTEAEPGRTTGLLVAWSSRLQAGAATAAHQPGAAAGVYRALDHHSVITAADRGPVHHHHNGARQEAVM